MLDINMLPHCVSEFDSPAGEEESALEASTDPAKLRRLTDESKEKETDDWMKPISSELSSAHWRDEGEKTSDSVLAESCCRHTSGAAAPGFLSAPSWKKWPQVEPSPRRPRAVITARQCADAPACQDHFEKVKLSRSSPEGEIFSLSFF